MVTGFIAPCLPSKASRPPSGPLWVHEIKHDGYRLMVRRDDACVRCFTRNGHDWADRFPAIVAAALRIKAMSFLGRLKTRVHLAGPMRGCENFNRAAFAHWAQVLRAKGHEVFSPSENSVRLFGGRALAEANGGDPMTISRPAVSTRLLFPPSATVLCSARRG